ncbi:MAG: hypothetical protein MUF30_02460 [Burkholderiales bacterium]|nr:hypothetical protein [Burkholderiales bacterium]
MRPVLRLVVVLCLASGFCAEVLAQDCSKPKSNTERLICSNDRVAAASERLAFAFLAAYRRMTTDDARDAMRRDQRQWEEGTRNACPDVPCLLQAYDERTLLLEQN